MRLHLGLIGAVVAALSGSVLAQAPAERPGVDHGTVDARAAALLRGGGAASTADIGQVLGAVHDAMNGKKFHVEVLPPGENPREGYDIQMGPNGVPRYLRQNGDRLASFDEFTGRRATSCAGAPLPGELVIEYLVIRDGIEPRDALPHTWDGWLWDSRQRAHLQVSAHVRSSAELLADLFDPFRSAEGISLGPLAQVNGHRGRALVRHHELRPGDYRLGGIPPDVQDWLWIDVDSLLMLRWEIRKAGVFGGAGYNFVPDSNLKFEAPDAFRGVTVPQCVD